MKFKIAERYNKEKAENGVNFEVVDAMGTYHGTFLCQLLDPHSERGLLKTKRIKDKFGNKTKSMKEYDVYKIGLVYSALIGWKDIFDEKGKEVPFSVEAAEAYFGLEDTRWIMISLIDLASDISKYQAEEKTEEEAQPEKN